jgi:hypothetical protein
MGMSLSEPAFFQLDHSRIEVVSASTLEDFNK